MVSLSNVLSLNFDIQLLEWTAVDMMQHRLCNFSTKVSVTYIPSDFGVFQYGANSKPQCDCS